MYQHTPYVSPRLSYRGNLYYLYIASRKDSLQAPWMSGGARYNTSLTFPNYKARFVQRDGTGKFHDGTVQINNKACNLRRFLSILRWLTYLQRFCFK